VPVQAGGNLEFNPRTFTETSQIHPSPEHFVKALTSMSVALSPRDMHRGGFWDRHFHNEEEVLLKTILDFLKTDYSYDYNTIFGGEDDTWVVHVLQTWCFGVPRSTLSRERYTWFMPPRSAVHMMEGADEFWRACKTGIQHYLTLHTVFNERSSERLIALQHIQQIANTNLRADLRRMLRDEDCNLRAVVSVALGRCSDTEAVPILVTLLRDPDRLVRKCACLTLARLQTTPASYVTEALMGVWRKDTTDDVRQAALRALRQVDCVEVQATIRRYTQLETELTELA